MTESRISRHLVALDTNIFIYHFQDTPKLSDNTAVIFNQLSKTQSKAVTSVITLIELLSFEASDETIQQIQEEFFLTPNLTVCEVTREISLEAARIRRMYGFRLPDAIQLATALAAKARTFITNDARLKKFKEIPISLLQSFKQ